MIPLYLQYSDIPAFYLRNTLQQTFPDSICGKQTVESKVSF